ncbi:tyrosine-type recombinase/integrase [Methylocystis sp. L43]|uniref:tyrosine-type recombinase/integrase n=1 Tax=unclassified Methylocystis TaxID=2625913 RepID=UPI0018C27DA2|nr:MULTISPECIES: site-specific integrase [unclassified Methylocystis]MBG0797175.1 tyrosine-type recombinase/integrase [Methylocystis sp. L43]MBG0804954.1 tyrosine-type recombinase/integrase [Methylocystis sp. H15]
MPKLTVKYIEGVLKRIRAGEDVKEWHSDGDGLYLRTRPRTGYASFEGRRRPYPPYLIGPLALGLPAARELWREALVKMARGEDPSAAKKAARAAAMAGPSHTTVEAALKLYEARHLQPNLRSGEAQARVLRKETAAWASRDIKSIGAEDNQQLIDAVIDRGAPGQAEHLYSYLSRFYGFCINRRLIRENPLAGIDKPTKGKARDRVLSDAELALVWRASDRLGYPFAQIFQLLILTGQRKSEIADAPWSEIDLNARAWRLPAERVKNKRPHIIPLSAQALAVIGEIPRIDESLLVFTTTKTTPASGFSRAKRSLDAAIASENGGEPIPPWTIHDIRRSVASGMARCGVDLHVVERTLNHVSGSFGGVVGVYQHHKFEREVRLALDRWGAHVESIVTGRPIRNVVELPRVTA